MKSWNYSLLLVFILLTLPSCALVTSYKKFTLQRAPQTTLQNKISFSDNFTTSLIFYEDGSCLLIQLIDPDKISDYLKENKYKVYGRFSDYHFDWGIYKVNQESIEIELLEKVHQWGFLAITRWNAIIKDNGKTIEILPGPVNRKVQIHYSTTFEHKGETMKLDTALLNLDIDPAKAWVNR